MNTLVGKSVRGQPVSFTDFFGMLLRDTIVNNKEATLSDMRRVLAGGAAPLPLFTSLHVKKNVSAKVFQVINYKWPRAGFGRRAEVSEVTRTANCIACSDEKYGYTYLADTSLQLFYDGHLTRRRLQTFV